VPIADIGYKKEGEWAIWRVPNTKNQEKLQKILGL